MKKRIISIILSIVMLVSLLPTTAWAASSSVKVGGVEMYSDSATYYVNGATEAVTEEPAYWNAKYENGTLTIKNLSVVGSGATAESAAGIYSTVDLNIVLEGANSVTAADVENASYAVYVNADLTISGEGALSATGGTSSTQGSYGIYVAGNELSIQGGTVVATGGSGKYSYGIYGITDAVSVKISGGIVVARSGSGTDTSEAIQGTLALTSTKIAGQVVNDTFAGSPADFNENATAVAIVPSDWTVENTKRHVGDNASISIDNDTAIVVSGDNTNNGTALSLLSTGSSTITLNKDLVLINLHGTWTTPACQISKEVTVKGSGTLTAIGAANKQYSYGIASGDYGTQKPALTVDGAKIIAIGGTASHTSYGMNCPATITSGSVTAIGGVAANDSYGIYASDISVSGTSKVTAMGGTYGLGAKFGSLAGGSYIGGTAAVYRDSSSNVKNLLATGCGYFAGDTQLDPGSSTTVGEPYQVVTVKEIPKPHSHCVCGGGISVGGHTHDSTAPTWTAWAGADMDESVDGVQLTAGSYYLTGDVEVNSVTIVGEVNLCLNGHTITTTNNYGAFHVKSGATLNICDCSTNQSGKIKNTRATTGHPGIRNDGGTVNVYGGTVSGDNDGIINISTNGGTVTVNVYGGTVSGAHAGINNNVQNSNLNIYSGTAQATGSTGYGIYNRGTVSVSGGIVTGGGNGIRNYYTGTINVSGTVQVSGSTGIYIEGGTLNLQGAPSITGAAADIYLNSDKLITIVGELTYTEGNVVSVEMKTPGTFTTGWNTYMASADFSNYFTSKNEGYTVQLDSNNELKLAEPPAAETHSHPICGATHTNIGDHTGTCEAVEWTALSSILGEADSSGRYEGATIEQAGKYYLDKDIPLYDGLIIAADVSLCLNGHTLTYRGTNEGVTVQDGAALNICDCSDNESGMINTYEFQANTIAVSHGTVNLYSGTLKSKGSIALRGYVEGGSYTINQYGGIVQADGTYDAVSIEGEDAVSAAYNLYGGTVETTSADSGYVISISGANTTLSMSGAPEISNASSWEYASDIYTETPIYIVGTLTANAPQYSVLYSRWDDNLDDYIYTGIFTDGWDTHMSEAAYNDYFVSADSDLAVLKDTSGELKLAEPPTTYTVTYNGNGATSGDVPADSNSPYISGSTVTVLGNTGNLAKEGYEFSGWNTKADGTGTHYAPDSTFTITSNTTLYAVWKVPHIHEYTYAVNTENAAKIIESCSCGHKETATVSGPTGTIVYDGTEKKGATVSYSTGWLGGTLTVTYVNNIYAGQATASITKAGATASVKFTINKAKPDYTLPTGITATYGQTLADVILSTGWSWKEPTTSVGDVGTKTFVAVFTPADTNNYNTVEAEVSVTVNAKQLTNPTIELSQDSFTYGGTEKKPAVTVEDGTTPLTDGVDYDITWPTDCKSAGTKDVTVTFKGNYSGTKTAEYVIVKADSSCIAPVAVADLVYTGSAQTLVTAATPTGGTVQYSLSETGTFSDSIPTGTDAGTYTVYYKVIGDANHNGTAVLGPVQVTISKAKAEITVDQTAIVKTFGETLTLPEATSNFGEVVCDKTAEDLVNVGSYTVTYSVAGTDNYEGDTKTVSVTINPLAVNEPSVTGTYTYTGEEQTATVTGKADYMTETGDVKGTDAGSYTITYTLDKNHCWANGSDGTVTWSIGKADNAWATAPAIADVTYGTAISPVGAANFGTATVTYVGTGSTSYENATAPTNAGTYKATFAVAATNDYGSLSKDVNFTIAQKEVGLGWSTLTADQLVYSKTEKTLTATATGVETGDTCDVTVALTDGKNNVNVTDAGFTFTATELSNTNYKLPVDTQKVTSPEYTITPKLLTLTGTTVEATKVYDGKTTAKVTANGTLSGVCVGDDVGLSATATYADKNVGENKQITVEYTITGTDAGNYIKPADNTSLTATITQKQLVVSGTTVKADKIYNRTNVSEVTNVGTLTNKEDNDDVTLEATATYDNWNVGVNKQVTVEYTISGDDAANYLAPVNNTSLTATITAKQLTATGTTVAATKVYDSYTTAAVTANGSLDGVESGDTVTFGTVTATYDSKDVGIDKQITVEYTISGADAGNYIAPVNNTSLKAAITPKPLTVSGTTVNATKVYDGNKTTAVDNNGTLDGVCVGDTVTHSATATYADKNVGENKTVTVVYAISGTNAGNYIKPADNTSLKAAITQKQLEVSGTTVSGKTYDRNTTASVTPGTLTNAENGDTVTLSATATYADKNVGENKTVTVEYAISGTDAANYLAPVNNTSLTATITAKQLTATGTTVAATKVYDSNATAAVTANGSLGGVESGDTVTFGTVTATYADKNVGTGKTVTVVYTIAGDNAGNYLAPVTDSTSLTAEITPKPITAQWTVTSKVYDGTAQGPGYTLPDVCDGDTIAVTNTKTDAGSYQLIATLDSANYTLTNPNVNFVIDKAPVTFTVADDSQQYDGNAKTATITAKDDKNSNFTAFTTTYKNSRGETVAQPTAVGNYGVYVKITNDNYRHADAADGAERKIGTLSIYQTSAPATYTVSFDGNSATGGSTATLDAAKAGDTRILPNCGFTKDGWTFTGWKYGDKVYKAGESFIQPAANVTFTAQWTKNVYTVGGIVKNYSDAVQEGAVVTLMSGARQVEQKTTGANGKFNFTNVLPGLYNLVVSYDGKTVTSAVEITNANETDLTVKLPDGKTNSVIEVAAGTPEVIVDGLEKSFANTTGNYTAEDANIVDDGGSVEFKLTVSEISVPEEAKQTELAKKSSNEFLYLDMDLSKTTITDEGSTTTPLYSSDPLLEITVPVPADIQGKDSYQVYRYHSPDGASANETLTQMKQLSGTDFPTEEGYRVSQDKTTVAVYTRSFSLYAITYQQYSGGGVSSYAVTVESAKNGTVGTDKKNASAGQTVTITVTPDKGFTLETLTVLDKNGKEVELTNLGNNKYSFKMPTGKVSISATFMEDNSMLNFFVDVKATDYYYDAVLWAAENDITKGTDAVHFSPNAPVTRAQVVTFLWRAAGKPVVNYAMSFADVSGDAYYTEAVRWAVAEGITKGTSDTTFSPDKVCTRGQIVTFLARFAGVEDDASGYSHGFTDVKATDYYNNAVAWAKDNKVTEGTSATTFSPNVDCTRAQVVTFLYRYMSK